MTLLVQITDTHIVERGALLYGMADTARHLAETVSEINAMRPRPDAVLPRPVEATKLLLEINESLPETTDFDVLVQEKRARKQRRVLIERVD